MLATAIPRRAVEGVPIVPRFGPEFPVAITEMTPASIALLMANDPPSTSEFAPPPSDKLMTFMPSVTDVSMALMMPDVAPLPYAPRTRYE